MSIEWDGDKIDVSDIKDNPLSSSADEIAEQTAAITETAQRLTVNARLDMLENRVDSLVNVVVELTEIIKLLNRK